MDIGENERDWTKILQPHGTFTLISAGELILFQGEAAKQIGLLISGVASARVNSVNGDEIWAGEFNAGDFFGHTSLLSQAPIDFEVRAETDVKVLSIPSKVFETLVSSEANLSRVLASDLTQRFRNMLQRLVDAITLSAPERVYSELLRLSKHIGIDPTKKIIRPVPVFVDLALRVNSTRETVSRTVSDLQKKGILSREPGAILIHKPEALELRVR